VVWGVGELALLTDVLLPCSVIPVCFLDLIVDEATSLRLFFWYLIADELAYRFINGSWWDQVITRYVVKGHTWTLWSSVIRFRNELFALPCTQITDTVLKPSSWEKLTHDETGLFGDGSGLVETSGSVQRSNQVSRIRYALFSLFVQQVQHAGRCTLPAGSCRMRLGWTVQWQRWCHACCVCLWARSS
jgi:hypothetical protein